MDQDKNSSTLNASTKNLGKWMTLIGCSSSKVKNEMKLTDYESTRSPPQSFTEKN